MLNLAGAGILRAEREPDSRRSMFVEPRFIRHFAAVWMPLRKRELAIVRHSRAGAHRNPKVAGLTPLTSYMICGHKLSGLTPH